MSGRLIALYKQPGVRPVGVGETWWRIFSKIVLKVAVPEATMTCQYDHLCAVIKAGIDGVIHGVQALWDENLSTEECGVLLIDANNAFNEINRVGMLWTFRHLWTSRSRFVFNCYRHWSSIVLQNRNGKSSIIYSREVVTQGGPLAMIVYGIGILPLIKNLKRAIPDITQPWYTDDAVSLGTFARLETYFYLLTLQGLGRGYHPKLIKSVLILCPDNLEAGKVFGRRHGFRVCTGACYLGGYIGDDKSKLDWLRGRKLMWKKNINMISEIMGKYPQESYAAVICAIQLECIFLQLTWDTGDAFAGVEKMIQETFLPRLFFRNTKNPLTHCKSSKYDAGQ